MVLCPGDEPPFIRRLREVVEAGAGLPASEARRQHYVPSFLLARWATPPRRKGKLAALAVASGHTSLTKPDKVAWERDLYTLRDGEALDLAIESFMAIIEEHAADPIKRLATLPESITDEDRWTIAFFLALQQGRTPPALADHRRLAEAAARQFLRERRARYDDLNAVGAIYRRVINSSADEREIRAFATAQKRAMPDPDGRVQTTPEAAFQSLFLNVSQITLTVVLLDWTLLTTEEEFIVTDRGLAMWDQDLPASRGNMWVSSPAAETTVPVAPNVCLKLTPGRGNFQVELAGAHQVRAINLRSYGWAAKQVFGTTTRILRDVHEAARAAPGSAPTPIVPAIHETPATSGAPSE